MFLTMFLRVSWAVSLFTSIFSDLLLTMNTLADLLLTMFLWV